jgi:hypothetical protein
MKRVETINLKEASEAAQPRDNHRMPSCIQAEPLNVLVALLRMIPALSDHRRRILSPWSHAASRHRSALRAIAQQARCSNGATAEKSHQVVSFRLPRRPSVLSYVQQQQQRAGCAALLRQAPVLIDRGRRENDEKMGLKCLTVATDRVRLSES